MIRIRVKKTLPGRDREHPNGSESWTICGNVRETIPTKSAKENFFT